MNNLKIKKLIKLYWLWGKIYPYLVSQIMAIYSRDSGRVLELGLFAGGISLDMAARYPKLNITIVPGNRDIVAFLRKQVIKSGFSENISIANDDFINLSFPDNSFDLVILRGAFFFIIEESTILQNISRVLKHSGLAIIGGGYGKDTPPEIIAEISDESRRLNDELGRVRVNINKLKSLITREHLTERCQIIEDGGIWIIMRK